MDDQAAARVSVSGEVGLMASQIQPKNHLLRLAQPLFWLLDELSPELESAARLDTLKSEVRTRLKAFKQAAQAAALKADVIEAVHYCFCAALDQAGSRVRGRADGLRGVWVQHSLLAEFYKENSRGQHCRAWIQTLQETPNASSNALEVIALLIKRGLGDERGMPLHEIQMQHRAVVAPAPAAASALTSSWARERPMAFSGEVHEILLLRQEPPPRRSWLPVIAALVAIALVLGFGAVTYRQHLEKQMLASRVDALSAQLLKQRETLEERVSRALSSEAGAAPVGISTKDGRIYLAFSSDQGFSSGRADLTPALARQLDRLAAVLADTRGKVTILGHTDDAPGPRDRIESNSALSTARAMAVGQRLQKHGVARDRLSIIGRGAKDSVGDNRTSAGRALNRRVEIVLENVSVDARRAQ
ncbi:DotU family type IV/VI secretion system protein [Ralstonia sp.]|uniref:DotU family type IV/VI secretion system protein n=1 Tax=Ralstonia sp. TaxID=54061 RepID=UPI002CDE45F4|nr:DotU family type IV/VI secretion system protein [Ralstonia sp.]HWV05565.1 DotU family type IV/VI secretion system protein [Ralstonia sp.]